MCVVTLLCGCYVVVRYAYVDIFVRMVSIVSMALTVVSCYVWCLFAV